MTKTAALFNTIVMLSATATVLMGIIFASKYGPEIEAKFFPVVTDFSVDSATLWTPSEMVVSGVLDKKRAYCEYKSIVAYLQRKDSPIKEVVRVDFLGTRNGSVRLLVKGLQTGGPWKVLSPNGFDDTSLEVTVYHRCHPFYLSRTHLLSVDLNKLLKNKLESGS